MSAQTVQPRDCWFLTGPTASGKTEVGLELAELLGAEIVSLDSMAVYRGMDIGTAKPTLDERRRVPHHLVDVVEANQEFSLAAYVASAHETVARIAARGRTALFVGGTPLYLKSLLRGIFSGPKADWALREKLKELAQQQGAQHLHARLAEVDPRSARRLHPRDTRRVIRALEIWEKTGQPLSELQQQFDRARPAAECRVFVLDRPRDELARRIDRRVEAMFAAGLVAEVEGLVARCGRLSRTASAAVGYREVIRHLEGQIGLDETIELVKLRTRQFAKRQGTWFRSLSECRTVSLSGEANPGETARQIARQGA